MNNGTRCGGFCCFGVRLLRLVSVEDQLFALMAWRNLQLDDRLEAAEEHSLGIEGQ